MLGVEALKEAGTPPKLLIIDDGWQLTRADGQGPLGGAHAPSIPPDASDGPPRCAAGWLAPPLVRHASCAAHALPCPPLREHALAVSGCHNVLAAIPVETQGRPPPCAGDIPKLLPPDLCERTLVHVILQRRTMSDVPYGTSSRSCECSNARNYTIGCSRGSGQADLWAGFSQDWW